ncbi:hypothetical protein WJX81_004636 [Elliptochloris bilobata]|uniref:tyrosine--tRNA ligase n=1 Tax=Elliptochloris bilobata TaxID=381761 RepID=A0AAW1QXZ5_9CHLO
MAERPASSQAPDSEASTSGSGLTVDEKVALCMSFAQECIEEAELRSLFASNKPSIVAYDGFEPSGRMHIAQGVMKALNVNKLLHCGVTFKFWVADWFAQLNDKMGGDLKKIKVVGEYMIEIWKACGMEGIGDSSKVQFLWASEEINRSPDEYWTLVMDVARRSTLARVRRCSQIMGREESDDLSAAQVFYPCMQCADVFYLKADICQLGQDQRKVNMLAREYCTATKRKFKPVILSHAMLPGLLQGQAKMSKSDPGSAIFMEDSEAEVGAKIKKAFCPPPPPPPADGGAAEEWNPRDNPCLEYVRMIVLPRFGRFEVSHKDGSKEYTSFEEITADYGSGALHPGDLKPALAKAINAILQPVREHFASDDRARKLLTQVKSYKTTR